MIFTDWTNTDPKYFYVRGVICGIVLATMCWGVILPWVRRKMKKEGK